MKHHAVFTLFLLALSAVGLRAAEANRLTYLDGNDPYYVSRTFPKLITPQWVGEKGVDAVVVLAIDDMRDHKKYEAYLRPILNRLKKIDGRAAVSIMTNRINPNELHLQKWLKEGVSIETHTFDHPCPFFRGGKFAVGKETYDKCVDLMATIPGSRAVAFRMPCCDSLNTPTPRFFAEIFNKTTAKGNFLTIDTSVFQLFSPDDPELPRKAVLTPDGKERFRKFLPKDRTFVNVIENYPYPYVIGKLCWQFPCMVPSDWEAQHLQGKNNPATIEAWQAALDSVVAKKGTFNMVFHPHGWIKNDQLVDFIDYAERKYGKTVKFLNFKEVLQRLEKNLLAGESLRHPKHGGDNGVRLLDVNDDGYLDVVIGNGTKKTTRIWSPKTQTWKTADFPVDLTHFSLFAKITPGNVHHFGILQKNGDATLIYRTPFARGGWHFNGTGWTKDVALFDVVEIKGKNVYTATQKGLDNGVRLRDLDGDGRCEMIVSNPKQQGVFAWSDKENNWRILPFTLPAGASIVDPKGRDNGVRFVDVNEDGRDDVIFSNENDYGLYLFDNMKTGWNRKVAAGKRSDKNALPMIANAGTNMGFFVRNRSLWWSNENTPLLKDHVARRSFNDLLKNVEPRAKSPQASLECIKVRPGFAVELVAAEPLVKDPVAFAWGPDGKFWVVEMGDYPNGLDGKGQPGGNIKFLEDTNGDGKYDKATIFLDKLAFPTGVAPWKKGVLVTCAPDIFYAEDTNGDGKADQKTLLYRGFGEGNQQHRVNALAWGLDNWIYVGNGDSGGNIKSLKTGKVVNVRGRDLRIRPWTGEMEAQSGQTQFGRARDDWGNWFGNNNSNPMFFYALADQYLKRNPHYAPPSPKVHVSVNPGSSPVYPSSRTLPRFNNPQSVNRFTSACSAIVYRDDLLGKAFRNNTFVCEPVHNLIHREVMTADKTVFTSRRADDEQQSEFLASSDNWFRPAIIKTGPDGALWVADMYRYVIEHPKWIPADWQKKLNVRAGDDMGRIYRICPVGKSPRPMPRLDKLDTTGLVAALDSPNGWQRDMAQQMLFWKQDRNAVKALEKLSRNGTRPQTRMQALCTLDGLNATRIEILQQALRDKHPGVRRHAIRLCEKHLAKSTKLGEHLAAMIDDGDAQVRMQLAYTLGEWSDTRAGKTLAAIALKNNDRFLRAAVMSSINKKNIEPMLLAVLASARDKNKSGKLVEALMQMAQRQGNRRVVNALLAALGEKKKGRFQPWQMAALSGFLDTLAQRRETLTSLMADADGERKKIINELEPMFDQARAWSADNKVALSERITAVRLLGRGLTHQKDDKARLALLLSPQYPRETQSAAAEALGKISGNDIVPLMLKSWKSCSPSTRSDILSSLLSRPGGEAAILDAVVKKLILPMEIDATRRQRLLQHPKSSIRDRAKKLLAAVANTDRGKVLSKYREAAYLKGNALTGKLVFEKTCAACHKIGNVGKALGPDLTALSDKSHQTLLIGILDPNRAVEAKYVSYLAVTKNGRTFSGLLAEETAASITLADTDGKEHVILRSDLDEFVSSGKSVMPDGLEKDTTVKQMADLLAFLRSVMPALKRREFPGNNPTIVTPVGDGSILLTAKNAAIYGKSIIFEQKYKNLGWWNHPDDRAVWQVDSSRAGKYAIQIDFACAPASAGNRFVINCGFQRITGTVKSTGSWDVYRRETVGELQLPAGRIPIVMQSLGNIRGALIDLKSIKLIPMSRKK